LPHPDVAVSSLCGSVRLQASTCHNADHPLSIWASVVNLLAHYWLLIDIKGKRVLFCYNSQCIGLIGVICRRRRTNCGTSQNSTIAILITFLEQIAATGINFKKIELVLIVVSTKENTTTGMGRCAFYKNHLDLIGKVSITGSTHGKASGQKIWCC